ncbi:hypothetical protein QBC37DRAFT_369078 [Rhypophila decipiens]|uniref:DUF676 domain-containing protein n=1 Tax=Rhypophila decipiens TaxID=261697 RepID=A0AAN7BC33_9PEZI|nr:hypothetical protein QBC37DRAFT_369078 [Rhypophila decipiens]
MEKINKKIARYEFTAVYTHPQAKADIVLVHGLNGDPQRTWTAPNGVFWPADLLPGSLKNEHAPIKNDGAQLRNQFANVLVYGYNADVYSARRDKSPSDNFVHQHAQSLVTSLTQFRKSEGTERNPIIWVAHSLGGILTKRALLYSNDVRAHHQEDYRSIFVSTYGIIFLGTPHTGSDVATWGRVLQQMSDAVIPRAFFQTESVLLKTLKKDNETLQSINSHFLDIYQRFRIHMVHENHMTDLKGVGKVLIVDSSSASPQLPGVTYYGIEASHSGICKFESENAPGYRNVSTAIREWVAGSPEVIEVRWEVEEDDRRLRAHLENYERSRPYERALAANAQHQELVERNNDTALHHSPTDITARQSALLPPAEPVASPMEERERLLEAQIKDDSEPLFIRPESFRPNSFFLGREDELRGLHEMLMDRKRRSDGTSAVLIQCLPGGGKTHLARQYVFQHKSDYPGGVYWVRAKSRHELEYWYWRIARNEALRGLVDRQDVEELRDPKRIVEIVRKWLNTQSDWLLVLDGIQFDTPGLHEFIPDAKHTSLIYTSTERAVTGDPRFDNPQVMELGLLTARQAQDLLLLEMDKKKPWSADDQAKALELVQLMGRLPLMIHVAAQHLKATREPLSRYIKSYKSRPKAGGLAAYKAVRDQLEHRGANAALNLISILAFFDQHIPVEMVNLGLAALDKITPVKTCSASHRRTNLTNTLRVLIAFALVERTESDDMSPSSSRSSKNSFDKHVTVQYLDLLRVHSVVQDFFIDNLNQQKEVHFWLDRAAAVWCRSYDEAHKRIQDDPTVGLPDDYLRFSIHGQKLLQHLQRFDKKDPRLLGAAQEEVVSRLVKIQGQVDQLSHDIQTSIIDGDDGLGTAPPASVFERSSTMSETDSAETVSAHESQTSWGHFGGSGDDQEPLQSPSAYDSVLATPARLPWNAPYPTRALMPPVPDIDDDEGTVVPPASTTPTMSAANVPFAPEMPDVPEYPASGNPLSESLVLDTYEDWQEVIPHHRVVKRNEKRRYRDRAGSWRDSTIGDPRVGLSLEVASGSLQSRGRSSRSSSRHRVTAQSDAEMELNKIRQAALAQLPTAAAASEETSSQPQLIPGKMPDPSPAATELGASPTESLTGLARLISSPASWKAAAIKIKNNLKATPPKVSLEQQRSPILPPSNLRQSQVPPDDDILVVPPGHIFRGSRTANSSPGSNSSPFPPPTFSATAEAVSPDEYLQAGLPVVVRRWETEEPPTIPTRFGESPEPTWTAAAAADPMSLSYPAPAAQVSSRREPLGIAVRGRPVQPGYYPQPLTTGSQMWTTTPAPAPPSGYTSQPMSRDPSHQSLSSSSPASASPPPARPRMPGAGAGAAAGTGQYPPSPLAMSSSEYGQQEEDGLNFLPVSIGGRLLQPFPQQRRQRRPSYTETEPSPRLDSAFPDVDTSYQRWEQLHNNTRKNTTTMTTSVSSSRSLQPVADDDVGEEISSVPASSSTPLLPPLVPTATKAARWQRLNRGRRSGGGGGGGGPLRSQSLSPSPSSSSSSSSSRRRLLPLRPQLPASSPQLLPVVHQQQQQSSPQMLPVVQSPPTDQLLRGMGGSFSSGSTTAGGGEVMTRTSTNAGTTGSPTVASSAGIRLADGRMVEFGSHSPAAAGQSPPLAGGSSSSTRQQRRRGSVPLLSSPLSYLSSDGGVTPTAAAAGPSPPQSAASGGGNNFGLGILQ